MLIIKIINTCFLFVLCFFTLWQVKGLEPQTFINALIQLLSGDTRPFAAFYNLMKCKNALKGFEANTQVVGLGAVKDLKGSLRYGNS